MNTTTEAKPTTKKEKLTSTILGAVELLLAVISVFIGMALDGTTEFGHHLMFIFSGICIAMGTRNLMENK